MAINEVFSVLLWLEIFDTDFGRRTAPRTSSLLVAHVSRGSSFLKQKKQSKSQQQGNNSFLPRAQRSKVQVIKNTLEIGKFKKSDSTCSKLMSRKATSADAFLSASIIISYIEATVVVVVVVAVVVSKNAVKKLCCVV
jgi:hypothetical protein